MLSPDNYNINELKSLSKERFFELYGNSQHFDPVQVYKWLESLRVTEDKVEQKGKKGSK